MIWSKEQRKAIIKEMADRIAQGEFATAIMRDHAEDPNWPKSIVSIYSWMAEDSELAELVARARELSAHRFVEKAVETLEQHPPPNPQGGTDSGFVQWQKSKAWLYMQLATKMNGKAYGDSQKVEHSGKVEVIEVQRF